MNPHSDVSVSEPADCRLNPLKPWVKEAFCYFNCRCHIFSFSNEKTDKYLCWEITYTVPDLLSKVKVNTLLSFLFTYCETVLWNITYENECMLGLQTPLEVFWPCAVQYLIMKEKGSIISQALK